MRKLLLVTLPLTLGLAAAGPARGQIDPALLRRAALVDTSRTKLNLDAVYNRPFLQAGKLPVALGGYVEANYQNARTNGVGDGHQFQMRRLTLFIGSSVSKRVRFLTELEFEDGTREISLEFAAVDFEVNPLLNVRGGVVLNPIGAFNQNHDGPKWEFVDRPLAATQLLPATWSNAGVGVYGKKATPAWTAAYEAYLTNGFDDQIIDNARGRTFLPASKLNPVRFAESFNGQLLTTAKVAVRYKRLAEVGLSHMGQVYNRFEVAGIALDRRRRLDVWAVDGTATMPGTRTALTGEWVCIRVDVPESYAPQYGSRQLGGFLDLVQPVHKGRVLGFSDSVLNLALRLEYVDWNRDRFAETGQLIGDETWAVVPALSWRPSTLTVVRLNYRYQWHRDLLGNPPGRSAAVQVGVASYF